MRLDSKLEQNSLNEFGKSGIEVLFENDAVLVVNKPAQLPVIAEGWDISAPYLMNILEKNFGNLWVVHRLDKPTSGALLIAKNADAHRNLNKQFENRQVKKIYHAIIEGVPKWRSTTSNQPLRSNSGHSHRTIIDTKNGKAASTSFRLLKSSDLFSIVEASPKTGRTHQIRAHIANLYYPILGDRVYGGHENEHIDRVALHSYLIGFENPTTNQFMEVIAPYPTDFSNALFLLGIEL
jgi:RluA family pseudouridine synthase